MIAREGFLYGFIPLILGVFLSIIRMWIIGLLFILISIFIFFFFRQSKRIVSGWHDSVYAPCDGRVIQARDEFEGDFFNGIVNKISIFMSIFNVHINYAPVDGVVDCIKYTPGGFKRANIAENNENNFIGISNGTLKVGVRQVAGWIARRIVCDSKVGDRVSCGRRFGLIKFGSRVDVYFPKDYNVCVKSGQVVRAGRTILGEKI